jgi:hypothetical protein
MPKISSYPNNPDPDEEFEFVGTDPENTGEGPTGSTETVTLETLRSFSLPLPTGGTYPGGTTEFLRADQTWAVPAGGGGGSTVWHDLVETYGADPTGTTSCSSALATACTAAVAAQPAPFGLTVPPGYFKVTAPQDLPYNLIMQGSGVIGGDVTGQFGGTWFQVSSAFSGTGTYVFGFKDIPAPTTYTGVNGALCSGFGVDGSAYTGAAVAGFYIVGPTSCVFSDILIAQMSGWGVLTAEDTSAAEIGPFAQSWSDVTADSNGTVAGGGFFLHWCEDSIFINCYSIGNNSGDGFTIEDCDNTKFTTCNSEWNANFGWHITGDWQYATGTCQFNGISTDSNTMDGFHVDATWTTGGGAGTGPCIISVNGLVNRRDGQGTTEGTGTYAGLSFGATTLPVVITGLSQSTNIGDGGAGTMTPNFGIYFSQTSYSAPIIIGPGIAWGYTAALRTTSTSNTWPTGVVRSNVFGVTGNNYAPTYGSVLT